MHENLMEEVVAAEGCQRALAAVKRNRGAAGIDRMEVGQLPDHLKAHWARIRTKLLAGRYVPSPVRRVEIPKPDGGSRGLGIPTVVDRNICGCVCAPSLPAARWVDAPRPRRSTPTSRERNAAIRPAIDWLRWHSRRGRERALRRLGLTGRHLLTAASSRGAWRVAASPTLQTALSQRVLHKWGFLMPSDLATHTG